MSDPAARTAGTDIDQWIADAEARVEASSAGPWKYEEFCGNHLVKVPGETFAINHCDSDMTEDDARFIVEAHNTDIPRALRLLKRIEDGGRRLNDEDPELHLLFCPNPDGPCSCAGEVARNALAYTGEE